MGAVIDFLNPLLAILGSLSLPLKAAWAVWLVWGVVQVAWYYRSTRAAPAFRTTPASSPRPVAVRPAPVKKPQAAAVAPYGTSDFIAALDQEQAVLAAQGHADSTSSYR